MKPFWILASIISLPAVAQTLEPVAPSGGSYFWPVLFLVGGGLVALGLVLWHKRSPSQADAAIATAKADLIAGWHKATDQVSALTNLARQQAVVIASPPVQAVINAGAPPSAAPAPVAAAPAPVPAPSYNFTPAPAPVAVAPAPVAAQAAPVAANPAPFGYTFGPNGRVANTGPDMGFGWGPFGVPLESQAMKEHFANLYGPGSWQDSHDNAVFVGPFPVASLTPDDKLYLAAVATRLPGCLSIHYSALSGTGKEIADVINWAESTNAAAVHFYNIDAYTGPLKTWADAYIAAHKNSPTG